MVLLGAGAMAAEPPLQQQAEPPGEEEAEPVEGQPEAEPGPPRFTEEVVVVGTRATPRSILESAAPIDAIRPEDLLSQGPPSIYERLRTLVPSFAVNTQPISDASTLVRPAMLRNLAPNHTLVLVNGKRRHRSAVIDWNGGNGVSFGSQGPNLAAIPAIALRRVEVLRDGAAAQYGSDAIAGVMNFLLRDDRSGGAVEFLSGVHGEARDGETWNVAGNVGLPLGNAGFANLSLEYGGAAPTDRSVRRSDVAELIAAGNRHVREPAQVWGSPDTDGDLKLFGNFGHLFRRGLQLYGHAGYARRTVSGSFFFRNPNTRSGVFSNDGGRTLLVGDVLAARGTGSAGCPVVRVVDSVPDPEPLARVLADEHCFSFQERFPGGFTPTFGGTSADATLVWGVRRLSAGGVTWDASLSVGNHEATLLSRGHGERVARAGDPDGLRPRQQPPARDRPEPGPVAAGGRPPPPGGRRGVAARAVRDARGPAGVVGGRAVRGAGIRGRFQRLQRLRPGGRRALGPRQRGGVRGRRAEWRSGALAARRRPPRGALRGLREHRQRQAVGPLRGEPRTLAARQRRDRVPGADARAAELVQRLHEVRSDPAGPDRAGHDPFHLPGGAGSAAGGRSRRRRPGTTRSGRWSSAAGSR